MKRAVAVALCIIFQIAMSSCTYLKYASVQEEYARIQEAEPGQVNLKHMIDRDTYFVFGIIRDSIQGYGQQKLAIAAYSSKFKMYERVDTMFSATAGTHYGLNLPEGEYNLIAFADLNGNELYEPTEVVGRRSVLLNPILAPGKVRQRVDIVLSEPQTVDWVESIPLQGAPKRESLFYPAGTIRSLDDEIFSDNMATLGMYDPASFLEKAPTMFYALEEELSYKIPVIFVHGIGGTARSFALFIDRLDRTRYKPWFFYYPSGGDLEQLAEFFYRIFLSGSVIDTARMPIIVIAHSMGGLVVREAINKYSAKGDENNLKLFISMATPFGGHPAAESAEKYGTIVLPAWRDVNPRSDFITKLYRKPIPPSVSHYLLYAYNNPTTVKLNENSDGVVPLSSQLHPQAQSQSAEQFGFDNSHTDILNDPALLDYVFARLEKVENIFPPDHLAIVDQGGFDVPLSDRYSRVFKYIMTRIGKYIVALAGGDIKPLPEQVYFTQVASGEKKPRTEFERDWVRFANEYPEAVK